MDNIRKLHWTEQLEDLLGKEGERCASFIWLHRESEKRYNYHNQILSIPAIILGTVNGSISVGSSAIFGSYGGASVIIGFVGILTSILGTLNTFYNNAKRAENHRLCALQYEKINRMLMIELALPRAEREKPDFLIKLIKNDFDQLNEISPPISDTIILEYKKRFKDVDITKPSICNGLDKININRIEEIVTPIAEKSKIDIRFEK